MSDEVETRVPLLDRIAFAAYTTNFKIKLEGLPSRSLHSSLYRTYLLPCINIKHDPVITTSTTGRFRYFQIPKFQTIYRLAVACHTCRHVSSSVFSHMLCPSHPPVSRTSVASSTSDSRMYPYHEIRAPATSITLPPVQPMSDIAKGRERNAEAQMEVMRW